MCHSICSTSIGVSYSLPYGSNRRFRSTFQVASTSSQTFQSRHRFLSGSSRFTRDAVAEHLRHVLASVEDTALALTRISRVYSDAPRRVKRDRVISLLARLYVDGNAFADNRRRAYETVGLPAFILIAPPCTAAGFYVDQECADCGNCAGAERRLWPRIEDVRQAEDA